MSLKLTGRRRYRVVETYKGIFGRRIRQALILQVELAGTEPCFIGGHVSIDDVVRWRDATVEDLTAHEFPMLVGS